MGRSALSEQHFERKSPLELEDEFWACFGGNVSSSKWSYES